MKTDNLIAALSADADGRNRTPAQTLAAGLPLAAVGVAAIHFALFAVRPDLLQALHTPRYLFKLGLLLLLALTSYAALMESTRPTGSRRRIIGLLSVAPLALLLGVFAELLVLPPASWHAAAAGELSFVCLTAVPVMALSPLAAAVAGLRAGATTQPVLSAVSCGMFAGGFAAAVYALHCPNDSPLYVALWYAGGIALATLAAVVVAPRFTRW